MNNRPLSITVIGLGYILAGLGPIAITILSMISPGADSPTRDHQNSVELAFVLGSAVVAIVAGLFMLRGADWARWLGVLWMGRHVGISILHSLFALVVHAVLFVALLFFLFRGPATRYFRRGAQRS